MHSPEKFICVHTYLLWTKLKLTALEFWFTSEQKSDDQTTTFKFMITQPYSEVF